MKYVFNKAAREGYDAVAFAPGIVHAERWGRDPAQMQVYYDKMIPASISNVGAAPAPEPVTKGSNRPPPETITVDGYTSVLYSLDDVNKRGNTVRDEMKSPNTMFAVPPVVLAGGVAALSPGEAEAMQKTIERVERDFPGFSADILTGAGEVALDLLGDVASPLGRASAPALLESLSQDPLTAEQIKEAAERGAGFFDYEIKTPTGKRYREAVTTGVESLFDYLSESGGSLDPVQFGFQKGVIPVLEALAPVAEAYVEGALDLDAFIRDEEDRKKEKALRKSAQPLVEVLSPI